MPNDALSLAGIPLHEAYPLYVQEAYGLTKEAEVAGLPIFTDRSGRLFAGGYDNLYTVALGEGGPLVAALTRWRSGKRYVRYAFSTGQELALAKRRHYLLTVPPGTKPDERLSLYRSKTRNQVRKSLGLITDVREGRGSGTDRQTFYELYRHTVGRLHGVPRPFAWFERLEAHFGEDARVIGAYHEGALIGANYYVRSGEYALLLANVSDERHWHLDVNNRLYDAYIESVIKQRIRYIDFGPGLASDTSHAHFKQGFGGVERFMADTLYAPLSVRVREALTNRFKLYLKPARRV